MSVHSLYIYPETLGRETLGCYRAMTGNRSAKLKGAKVLYDINSDKHFVAIHIDDNLLKIGIDDEMSMDEFSLSAANVIRENFATK